MKKVFAFLSTILLTIAFVGVLATSAPAQAASNKITADPTLAADEIPVYIMDSIYTTFPNYYDNDAKADPNWLGMARMYPWNETRLRVAQLDENGAPTGKYYAVYFSGHTTHLNTDGSVVIGAGKNILFWDLDENGNVIPVKYSDGKKASSGNASDPSLSHMRTNITGQAIEFDPSALGMGDEGTNFFNRMFVIDGQGRMVRGLALDTVYDLTNPGVKLAPQFGYVNGQVKKLEEGDVVDKVKVPQLDENGEIMVDENGDSIMVDGEEDNLITTRFIWEWFETKPENVNTVSYLSEGWDPALWDYCWEQDGGYMAVCIMGGGADSTVNVKGAQIAAYEATLVAAGKTAEEATEIASKAVRSCVKTVRVPAGGFTFDYGYLDKGNASNDQFFNDSVVKGYFFGRQTLAKKVTSGAEAGQDVLDEEGNPVMIGMAEQKTYNFSVSDIKFDEKVLDDQSYQLVQNQYGHNVVEVMIGSKFTPHLNINYNGVMRYWKTEGDLTSYQASADALEFYVSESKNGGTKLVKVEKASGYAAYRDIESIKADFLADVAAHKGVTVDQVPFDTAANWHAAWSWGAFLATNADNATKVDAYPAADDPATPANECGFFSRSDMRAKWGWLLTKIYETMLAYPGGDTYAGSLSHVSNAATAFYAGSPQTINYAIWYFLSGQTHSYFGFNFADGNNATWIDPRTNLEQWQQYEIDATTAVPNDNWEVEYKVVNSATGVSSSLTVKYVAVDSYTPIVEVDEAKLLYFPKNAGGLKVIDPIDPRTIVKAYDAQYNGVSIKGNDISHNVQFETELDFNEPKEGKYPVVATVWNNSHTKSTQVKFVVEVKDVTAPMVITRNITLLQGDDFDPRAGILVAYDEVDGNLFDIAKEWVVLEGKFNSNEVDSKDENKGYTDKIVKVSVYDMSNNYITVTYKVTIVHNKALTSKDFEAQINAMNGQLQLGIDDVQDSVDELLDAAEAAKAAAANQDATLAGITAKVDALSAKGCKSGAAIAIALASVVTLVALVLRKRH